MTFAPDVFRPPIFRGTRAVAARAVLLGLFAVLMPGRDAHAAEEAPPLTIEAEARPSVASLQQDVTYVVTVEGASLSDIDRPPPPQARGLTLQRRRPTIEQDLVRRNGRLQRTVSFRWTYRPQRRGSLRFAPMSVTVNGTTHRTASVTVEVQSGGRTRPNRPPAADDAPRADTSDDLFIETALSDSLLYRGEQAVVSYRLFYHEDLRLRQSRLAGSWNAPGFWREELDVPSRPDVGTTRRNGKSYKTLLLKRVAVFPTRTGTLTLSPLEIETDARNSSSAQGLLRRFFSSDRTRELKVTSDSVQVQVRPLPGGAPPSFRGTVGSFRLDLRTSQTRTQVGEAVEIELEVSGYGNLATINAPALQPSSGDALETYAPDERLSIDREGERIRGTKTFTYTVVPQERGAYQLPPLQLSYFAPDAERYQTLRTRSVTIRARGGSAGEGVASAGGGALPPGDLAGPLTGTVTWTRPAPAPFWRRGGLLGAAFGGAALLAAVLLAWRRRRARAAERPTPAHPAARRRLREARRHLKQDRPRRFYEETERALRAFVAQRLDGASKNPARRRLRTALTRAGVATETQQALFDLLDECERARFAPTAPDRHALETASERAHRVVAALDEALARDA